MRRAGSAIGLAFALAWMPGAAVGQTRVEPALARALEAARPDSLLPILIEWEAPALPPRAPGFVDPAAVRTPLEAALRDRTARARAFLDARGLGAGYRERAELWVATATASEATPAVIEALASAPGVRRIYSDELLPVAGLEPPPAPTAAPPQFVPWGVEAVGAPLLWQAGITGKGRVVAFIDSGVDGSHPLLAGRWRGRSRSPREAWLDPWGRSAEPVDDIGHGTIVATTAVGALAAGDTLITGSDTLVAASGVDLVSGVAPEAEWIAANAFESFGGDFYTRRSILLQSMQWLLDPDGDPETSDDVPDVVNNSWGELPASEAEFCTGFFFRAIDALERAGVAVIFAAGNGSPGDPVVPPASRADLLTNAFAVGAVQQVSPDSFVVAGFSLGGPSPCDPTSVKPEVVAPGFVPTFTPFSDRTVRQGAQVAGTSFSAPHASGAVALLRQASPFVPSDDAKRALLETADDLYPPGPDNASGTGLIDVVSAAARVATTLPALLRVLRWEEVADTGDFFTLANLGGAPLGGGTLELLDRSPGPLVLNLGPPLPLPSLAPGDSARVGPFGVPTLPSDGLPVELVVRADGRTIRIPLVLHPKSIPAGGIVLQDGAAQFALDGAGRYGRVAGAPGFSLGAEDPLIAASFWLATGDRVSDAAYEDVRGQSANKTRATGTAADWRLRRRIAGAPSVIHTYDDGDALLRVGATVHEEVRLVSVGDTAAYAVISIALREATGPLDLAFFADWDFDDDTVYWSAAMNALVARSTTGGGTWTGLATSLPVAGAFAVPLGRRDPATGRYAPGVGVLSGGFEDAEKLAVLGGGARAASDGTLDDWAALLKVGPVRPSRGVVGAIPFILAIAPSESALAATLAEARSTLPPDPLLTAGGLTARPPFPNPFNPLRNSAIRFPFDAGAELRGAGREAVLEIFTIAGRPVYRQRQPLDPAAALQPFEWDGRAADGSPLASGMYVYRIRAGGRVARGKFLILK